LRKAFLPIGIFHMHRQYQCDGWTCCYSHVAIVPVSGRCVHCRQATNASAVPQREHASFRKELQRSLQAGIPKVQ
jgi:hypothetical protein